MKKKTILTLIIVLAIFAVCLAACGKKKYEVSYETDGNGTIQGEALQELKSGEETTAVTAIPNEGYAFVKWSDDNTNATRTDKVEDGDLKFTATFEKLKFSVIYSASDGGYIDGVREQTVEYGASASEVIAVPLEGYRFAKWLDNDSNEPVRNDAKVTANISATANFELIRTDIQFINYTTDGNGTIEGKMEQQVVYDKNATAVTAVPNEGYEFLQWSDGVKTAERQDLNVTESKTLTAQFKRVFVNYKLNYKLGKADTEITEFKFYDNDFMTVDFPVPTRELFTFGGWYIGDVQVTDINGNMTIGEELLKSEEKEIYAKWTANENYTYKILMVYVTELDADVLRRDETKKDHIYYKMSDFDIQICKMVTKQVSYYLNDLLDGLVTFEVDEYFTTACVGSESISTAYSVDGASNFIMANDIPELQESGLLGKYGSSLVVFFMGDYELEYRYSAGSAENSYGTVYLESVYGDNVTNNEPLEYLLDFNFWRWRDIIEPFLHELAHTIEEQMVGSYEYHSVIGWALNHLIYDHILMNKLYYLNLIEIDGKKVGIPLEFWKGELELIPPD